MSFISQNIKTLRKKAGLTQEKLAEQTGIKRSLVGAYEEGRAEPGLNYIITLSAIFNVSSDLLIGKDLSKPENYKKETENLRVLTVSVDKQNNENIILVPQKAAAGYLNGYADPEYIGNLPSIQLPNFSQGSFRGFEISGDSMLPIIPGTIIIGKYVENWRYIKNNKTYILVTKSDGIVYKRIINDSGNGNSLTLFSDNILYDPYSIMKEDLLEVWEAKAFISTSFPEPDGIIFDSAEKPAKNNKLGSAKKQIVKK